MHRLLYGIPGLRKIVLIFENFLVNLYYRKTLGSKINTFGLPIITYTKKPNFHFGENISMISSIYFSKSGINHPVIIRQLFEGALIKVGNNVGMNGSSINAAIEVQIGDNVLIGSNAIITDTDYHPVNPENRRFSKENIGAKPVKIGDNVFIGKSAMILKGVTVGENSVIAAASLVVKDIPANEVWGGNPAKFIKNISTEL